MATITKTIVACLLALSVGAFALPSAQACGPYDPAGFLKWEITSLEEELESASQNLEEVMATKNRMNILEAAELMVQTRKKLKESKRQLADLENERKATAQK